MKLKINLEKPYEIIIGHDLINLLKNHLNKKKSVVITDSNVEKMYGAFLKKLNLPVICFEAGEESKDLLTYSLIISKLHQLGYSRDTTLIAFGGGVVGDITGFVASTYMRGIAFLQVPTTLLAMVDSSIGGKTAINLESGKNIIGTFYQPEKVFVDIDFLKTLPEREFLSGLIEALKAGIIGDKELFNFIEKKLDEDKGMNVFRENKALEKIIFSALKVKAKIVEKDEKEKGLRMELNLGHTFGHAIESSTGYNKYFHGEAIGLGIINSAVLSVNVGTLDRKKALKIITLINKIITAKRPNVNKDDFIKIMLGDKKKQNDKLNLILIEDIGKVVIRNNLTIKQISDAL